MKAKVVAAWVGELTSTVFPKLVVIEWVDSTMRSGWTSDEYDAETQICVSIGWITAESKVALSVSPHISIESEPQRNGTMTIPKSCIKRIANLI